MQAQVHREKRFLQEELVVPLSCALILTCVIAHARIFLLLEHEMTTKKKLHLGGMMPAHERTSTSFLFVVQIDAREH